MILEERGVVVLGVTPSWQATGWVLMRLEPKSETVLQAGVIWTRDAWSTSVAATRTSRAACDPPLAITRRSRGLVAQLRIVAGREPLIAIVRRTGDPTPAEPLDLRAYGALDAIGLELEVPVIELDVAASAVASAREKHGEALGAMLDEDEVSRRQQKHAVIAAALVLAAAREPVIAEGRALVRRRAAGAIAKT